MHVDIFPQANPLVERYIASHKDHMDNKIQLYKMTHRTTYYMYYFTTVCIPFFMMRSSKLLFVHLSTYMGRNQAKVQGYSSTLANSRKPDEMTHLQVYISVLCSLRVSKVFKHALWWSLLKKESAFEVTKLSVLYLPQCNLGT